MDIVIEKAMNQNGLEEAIAEMLPMFSPYLDGMSIRIFHKDKGFRALWQRNSEAVVFAQRKSEVFRSLCAIAAAVKNEEFQIEIEQDTPFTTRGVMYDCSRNSVPKVETVKLIIRRIAMMGLNALMLYTEDVYSVPGVPALGHYRGRFSAQEMQAIDDYAGLFGIEVIPCIQTVAHLERLLRWRTMCEVRDDKETLYVGKDETYDLIEKMIMAVSTPLRSRRIHLGLDEAHGLGLGRRLNERGYETKCNLMREHLARILEICGRLGVKPMMWGDMLFRMHVSNNDYYDENVILPLEMGKVIPDGFDVFYWDYYHAEPSFYEKYIGEHQRLGIKPLFAGGVCSWLGMQPNFIRSKKTIEAGLSAARKAGLSDVFTCVWRDDGGEGLPGAVLPGIQYFAENCWEADTEKREALQAAQSRLVSGMTAGQAMDFGSFDELKPNLSLEGLEPANPHKYFLWQDPLLGQFDVEAATGDYALYYREKALALQLGLQDAAPESADAINLAIALAQFLSLKSDIGVLLKRFYDMNDRDGLYTLMLKIKDEILPSLEELHVLHKKLWMKYYKPFGWEVQDIRYGGLEARMGTTIERLKDFLSGDLGEIDELSQPRLTYEGGECQQSPKLPCFNLYRDIATVSNL